MRDEALKPALAALNDEVKKSNAEVGRKPEIEWNEESFRSAKPLSQFAYTIFTIKLPTSDSPLSLILCDIVIKIPKKM